VFESATGSIRLEFRSDSVIHWKGYKATFDLIPTRGVLLKPYPCYRRCIVIIVDGHIISVNLNLHGTEFFFFEKTFDFSNEEMKW
jgi:hypothetical protein